MPGVANNFIMIPGLSKNTASCRGVLPPYGNLRGVLNDNRGMPREITPEKHKNTPRQENFW